MIIAEGCGIYSFTGASIPPGVTTFQVNFFENLAGNRPGSTVEPGLDNDFTNALQDIICLLYTSPSPRDMRRSRMPSSA